MAMNDFVRRSMQIVAGGIAQSTTDYFDNAISFVNDVKEVVDMGKQMGSDGAKKFNELKNSGILKKTRDWFYNEGGMFGDFDFDDDDFDAGFEIDSADSESGGDKSQPLSKDMMTDIAKKQTGAMYKAFGRQADLHIANTAEIISTINTRTAELTASVNNVNNTLIQIGKRLDLIVESTSARTKKEEELQKTTSILDYGGGISLAGVAAKAKENAEDSMLGTFLSIGKTMLGSGMMTPETVLSMILSQTILEKKWDKLGGKSINDIGEFINDTVGEVIQNTMTSILKSKNSVLESLFEDIITKSAGKNYQHSVVNQYNDKPAVFDGMTRKSIVTIIPEYLREILKAVGGPEKTVDKKGNVVSGARGNAFVGQVSDNLFRSGMMDLAPRRKAEERTGLSSQEVNNAVRTMTGAWLWQMYVDGTVILDKGQVKNILDPTTRKVINNSAKAMSLADPKHRSVAEWEELYWGIVEQIEEFKYRQELQHSAEKADKNFENFARTDVNGYQAGQITGSVWLEAFKRNYKEFNDHAKFNDETKTPPPSAGPTPGPTPTPPPAPAPTQIGSGQRSNIPSTFDYVAGIFNQLNRGMNVFITGSAKLRKDPYEEIKMVPGYGNNAHNVSVTTGSQSSMTEAVQNAARPVTEAVKIADSFADTVVGDIPKDTLYDNAPDDIKSILDKPEDEWSDREKKKVDKYKKKKRNGKIKEAGKAGWDLIKGLAGDDRNYAIDPNVQAMMEIGDNLKKSISEKIPDGFKEFVSSAKEKITGTRMGEAAVNGISSAKSKAGDAILGKKTTDEEGNAVRNGGILHAVAKPVVNAGSAVSDAVGNAKDKASVAIASTSKLESDTKDLLNEYNKESDKYVEHADQSEHDVALMQMLGTQVQAIYADKDYSTIDDQDVAKTINAVEDPALKQRLKQTLVPLLKRNGKKLKLEDDGADNKPKSTIGKLAKLALGGIKMFLAPVIGYVKIVLFGVFKFIKGFGGAILKFAKWGIMRGLRQIKYGMKSLGFGIKTMFKSMTKLIKPMVDGLYSAVTAIKNGVTKAFSNIGKSIKDKVGGWMEKSGIKDKLSKDLSTDENGEKKKGLFSKISGAKEGLANKFAEKPGFMKGFTKAYRDRKEAEKKASLKEQAAPTTTALQEAGVPEIKSGVEEIVDTIGQIKDALTGKDPKGIVEEVKVQFQELKDKLDEESQEIQDNADGGGENAVAGALETTQAEVTDITMNGGAAGGVEGAVTTGATLMTGGAAGGAAGAAEGAAAGAAGAGAAEGAGAAMGGMMNVLMGISNIVLTIVMSLEGFKAMISTVTDILTEALMPLNDAFHAIIKTLKPYVKQLGSIVKQLAGFIVQIVEVVCDIIQPIMKDVIQPILEVLSPLLESIIGCLTPLLKIVGILLKVILAPLMGLFKFVLLPILKIIGDAVQIIMGVLQIGFGVLMMGIGGIISAIGGVLSLIGKIPVIGAGAKKLGSGVLDTGKEMMSQGKEFVVQGGKSVAQGAVNLVLDYASLYTMGMTDELLGRNEEEKKETKQIEAPDGNQVESTFANGDVTNVYNTYGGEYQRGMGGYLNMNQRGCGPIALADMYNRNSEGRISARSLAGMMNQSGAYDPHRGTSVGDYIDTARGLGMNVHAGKVTQQSLKSASPTNPITVVGSGSDYGTRNGNNHFMNVIGTDHHGGAYVSNPLTGRIDRRPASTVAGSAVMGIYGSGDEAEGGYSFPDAIKEAFKKLKDEAAKILGLFSMEKSDEEETEDLINAEKKKEAVEQAKKQTGNDYDTYADEAKGLALEDFKTKYPQKDGESDEDYQKRFDNWWETKANQAEYLAKTELLDAASKKGQDAYAELAKTNQKFVDDYAGKVDENGNITGGLFDKLGDAYTELDSAMDSLGSSSGGGGSGYFSSNEGVEMWTPYGDNIQITETDITKGPANAPLFEFFAKTMGLQLGDIYGSGWFSHYNNPNKEGVGSGGDSHSGVDFTGGEILGKPLYATTGGKVIANWSPSESGGGGNTVIWEDSAGKLHWYMHMNEQSELKVGDQIEGGDLIGYAGNTGHSTGPHLHYTINDTTSSSGGGHVYNPLMYFSNYNPSGGAGVALGDTDEEKIYSYLTTAGMTPIGASGLMGCFKYESDMKTNNLENSFNDMFGMSDSEYTSAVDSGKETEQQFLTGRNMVAFSGQTPGEAMGYGIAQFTSSGLKKDLYDKTVKKGKSIASLEPQLDAIISVLKDRGIYDTINNAATPTDANKTFLWKYEAGTGYTSDAAVLKAYPWMTTSNPDGTVLRHQYAEQVYKTYKDWKPQRATNGFTDSNGAVHINSAGDEKMYKNLKQTGSTSGKGTGVVITKEGQLNVRKDKSINSDIIGQLNSGDQIEIEACNSTDWLYVPSLGGYVSADFVNVITSDNQNEDWGVQKYTGPINSAADARMAAEGYGDGTQAYTISGYTGSGSTTVNSNHDGDAQWYKTDAGDWKFDERVFAKDDPRWRAAWYDESSPQHYDEARSAYDALAHMVIVGNNPNIREGKYYNNLVKAYGGGSQGKDAVKSLYDDVGNWQEWKSSRDKYVKKKKKDRLNAQFTEDLWYLHNAYWPDNKLSLGDINTRIKGSGDMDEMDFWDSYLGWNNKYANSNITTPVGEDSIDSTSEEYYDEATGTTVVNTYNVTRGEDKATEARLKAILANTYNVRSESMEALLEAILEELKHRKGGNPGPTNTSGSSKLFDERIPSQVTKLSVG